MKEKNRLLFIDKLILYYFVFQIFFLRWYNGNSYIAYIAVLLILRILFKLRNNIRVKSFDVIWCTSYILIVLTNILVNGFQKLFRSNVYSQGVANLFVIMFFLVLSEENREGLKNFILKDIFIIFNIYFIINVPILYKQLNYTYFLMRGISNNPMYEDHITGLIGQSGTHQLTFYWIVLTIINLYKYAMSRKKYVLALIIPQTIFMVMISSRNDNTAFFIIFPMIVFEYVALNILKKQNIISFLKNVFKTVIIVTLLVTGVMHLYKTNEDVNKFVNNRVLEKLEQFSIANKGNRQTSTSKDEERIALFKVALEDGRGYKFGHGIGSIESYGDFSMPQHFGMSEISLRTYEGGIIYLAILILIFSHFLERLFIFNKKIERIICFIIILGNLLFMSIYTTVFREPFYSFALSILAFMSSEKYMDIKRIKKGRK